MRKKLVQISRKGLLLILAVLVVVVFLKNKCSRISHGYEKEDGKQSY